jgi:hypothetical protein
MFLQRPGNMNEDDWWLHVYVMISRVRTSPQVLVYGLPPLSLFQRGPPSFLAEGMNRLERLATQHAILARRAREALGWSLRCESSQVSASSILPSVSEHKFDSDAGWAGMMHDPALSSRLLDPGADPESGDFFCDDAFGPAWSVAAVPLVLPSPAEMPASIVPSASSRVQSVALPVVLPPRALVPKHVPLHAEVSSLVLLPSERAPSDLGLFSTTGVEFRRESLYSTLNVHHICLCSSTLVACGRGLPNPAGRNLCFINSVVQVLLRIRPFVLMLNRHHHLHKEAKCVACVMSTVSSELYDVSDSAIQILTGMVREGVFGDEFMSVDGHHPQCDATTLMFSPEATPGLGMMHVLRLWEASSCEEPIELAQSDSVADHYLWTVVLRQRSKCCSPKCGFVLDTLIRDCGFRFALPLTCPQRDLLDLLRAELRFSRAEKSFCGRPSCCSETSRESFIEREPSVLMFRLQRAGLDSFGEQCAKSHVAVAFPEVLCCMRSGMYHFSGFICHVGELSSSGHYVACCWLGQDSYRIYDDSIVSEDIKWKTVCSPRYQKQVVLLVYSRTSFWAAPCDGTLAVPYARDQASEEFVSRQASLCSVQVSDRTVTAGHTVSLPVCSAVDSSLAGSPSGGLLSSANAESPLLSARLPRGVKPALHQAAVTPLPLSSQQGTVTPPPPSRLRRAARSSHMSGAASSSRDVKADSELIVSLPVQSPTPVVNPISSNSSAPDSSNVQPSLLKRLRRH